MDVVSELINRIDLHDTVYRQSSLTAPWGLTVEDTGSPVLHAVRMGTCCLTGAGLQRPLVLSAGDAVFLPQGRAHEIKDRPDTEPQPVAHILPANPKDERDCLHAGGGGSLTISVCGYFVCDGHGMRSLLETMPPILLLGRGGDSPCLESIMRLVEFVHPARRSGSTAIIKRVTEILLAEIVGAFVDSRPEVASGLHGLFDPGVERALASMNGAPERRWTSEALAARAGMSRTRFFERFRSVVGVTPRDYLSQYRMRLASTLLRGGFLSLGEIAEQVGFESASAFSKAFKRSFGVSPSMWRQSAHGEYLSGDR